MQRLFKLVLHLYPAHYRNVFGPEMSAVFATAAAEHRADRRLAYFAFVLKEFAGLLSGALKECFTRECSQHLSGANHAANIGADESALPEELLQARGRVAFFRSQMVRAIASHDFVKARLYSQRDYMERETLRQLGRNITLVKTLAKHSI